MFREGDIAIRPGELPAPRGEIRGRVSLKPLIITRPPKLKVALTPCEARTRFCSPLAAFLGLLLPQERKLRLAHNPTTRTRMRLFKRKAPNGMKKGDLIAKCWIITDPESGLMRGSPDQAKMSPLFPAPFRPGMMEMHEPVPILYSLKIYGI